MVKEALFAIALAFVTTPAALAHRGTAASNECGYTTPALPASGLTRDQVLVKLAAIKKLDGLPCSQAGAEVGATVHRGGGGRLRVNSQNQDALAGLRKTLAHEPRRPGVLGRSDVDC